MKTFRPATIVILIILMLNPGCKKNNDKKNKQDCRIITVSNSPSGVVHNFTYNSDGKLSTITQGNLVTTFAYSGNTAVGTTQAAGIFNNKKIITLNADGLASNVRTEYNAAGSIWDNIAYSYNGTDMIKSTKTSFPTPGTTIINFTWNNGNYVSYIQEGYASGVTVEYYMDKPAQMGDFNYIDQLKGGYQVYKTKNLVKSLKFLSTIYNFDYTFDADGKITSIKTSGSSVSTDTHQYQCN